MFEEYGGPKPRIKNESNIFVVLALYIFGRDGLDDPVGRHYLDDGRD